MRPVLYDDAALFQFSRLCANGLEWKAPHILFGGANMSIRRHRRPTHLSLALSIAAAVLAAPPFATPHAQPGSQPEPNRAELLKVKPNIAGIRDGHFLEPDPMDFADHTSYTQIFDGKTLTDWDGMPGVWKVEDGAIVGESTADHNAGNSFIVYHGAEAKDFDLKLEIKAEWAAAAAFNTAAAPAFRRGALPPRARLR